MFRLQRPSALALEKILQEQAALVPTYPEVGLTRDGSYPAAGYKVHTVERCLGHGVETFERAVSAMRQWKNFAAGWVNLYPAIPQIAEGTNLIVCAHHVVIWSVNVCRIIYVI